MGFLIAVIRHGVAEEKAKFRKTGKKDALRPLTAKGITKMRANSRGIKRIQPELGLILTSPWLRATQTAIIVQKVFRDTAVEVVEELIPSHNPAVLLRRLARYRNKKCVAIVGHEPQLSEFVAAAVGARAKIMRRQSAAVEIKKGSLCILEFSGTIELGKAKIRCLIPPQILRALRA